MTRQDTDDTADQPPGSERPTGIDSRATQTRSSAVATATRRSVLGAAGAGAGALAFGTGSVGADSHGGDLPRLSVDGPRIVDATGAEVPLRGVTIPDPRLLDHTAPARGKDASQLVDLLTDGSAGWHPTVVRITVDPRDVARLGRTASDDAVAPVAFDEDQLRQYLTDHLDPLVDQLASAGVYAMVSFRRAPDGTGPRWDEPAIDREVRLFWSVVAPRYAGRASVLFDLCALPLEPGIWSDPREDEDAAQVWYRWKETAQPWVDLVREHGDNVVVVSTPGFNQSPSAVTLEQFDGSNLAYGYHGVPGVPVSRDHDWSGMGAEANGTAGVAADVPLFVTSWAWKDPDAPIPSNPPEPYRGTTSGFGEPFLQWMESRPGVYWTADLADVGAVLRLFERPFTDAGPDELSDRQLYEGEVEAACPDRPCDWALLGEDVGEFDAHSGGFVRQALERLQADVSLSPPEQRRIAAPSNLEVTDRTRTEVALAWDAVDGAEEYRVTVDGHERTVLAATGLRLEDLLPGFTYEVEVQAIPSGDAAPSPPAGQTVDTLDPVAGSPSQPSDPRLDYRDGEHVVTWSPVDAAAEYAVTVDGRIVARQTGTTAAPAALGDGRVTVGVAAVDDRGRTSDSATLRYLPPADRDPDVSFQHGNGYIGTGTETTPDVRAYSVPELFAGVDVELTIGGDGEAAIVDAAPADAFDSGSVDTVPADGTTTLSGSVEGPPADAAGTLDLFSLTVEPRAAGTVEIDCSASARYADASEPVPVGGDELSFDVYDDSTPAAPDDVTVTGVGTSSLDLSWSAVSDATSYRVYYLEHGTPDYDGEPASVPLDDYARRATSTADTSATVEELDPGTTYAVGVTAVDDAGDQSPASGVFATTAGDGGPSLSVELASTEVDRESTTEARVRLSEAPEGVLGGTVELSLSDPSLATLGDVTFSEEFDLHQVLSRSDGAVTIDVADTEGNVSDGATDVPIATVAITGSGLGELEVTAVAETLSEANEQETELNPDPGAATLEVVVANWNGSVEYGGEKVVPDDVDGDGLYMDVTGDGDLDQNDVVAFFQNMHRQPVQGNPLAFDFSGNGDAGHGDVVALFEHVAHQGI